MPLDNRCPRGYTRTCCTTLSCPSLAQARLLLLRLKELRVTTLCLFVLHLIASGGESRLLCLLPPEVFTQSVLQERF